MFTNNFFSKFITGNTRVDNEAFCHDISLWAFAQTGVLRYHHNYHIKQDGSLPETILSDKSQTWELAESMHTKPEASRNDLVYRVKDDVQYSVIIEEFHGYGAGGELIWKPFIADDIQLEFVMLDPYVRQTMSLCNNDSELCDSLGLYTAKLKVPDVHGVFKFRILYRRLGYSVLHVEDQVVVRPFSHNEFERFIPSAYPYYFSVFITLAGFLSLIFVLQFT